MKLKQKIAVGLCCFFHPLRFSECIKSPSSRVQGLMLLILSAGEMHTENVRLACWRCCRARARTQKEAP